jgi:hypothetical protein
LSAKGRRNIECLSFIFIKKNTQPFEIIIHVTVVESVREHNTPPVSNTQIVV